MARFYRIQIDDLYFTETGLVAGSPCKLEVLGVPKVRLQFTGTTEKAIDGEPVTLIMENETKGRDLVIKISRIRSRVLDDLIEMINEKVLADQAVRTIGTGASGDFDVFAKFLATDPISFGEFIQDYIKNVVIRLITTIEE